MKHEIVHERVKICNYRGCGVPFEWPHNMKSQNWAQTTRCPKHRKMSGKKKPAEARLGHYEVKNPVIDSFISGKL
jgi:hypothetical protein